MVHLLFLDDNRQVLADKDITGLRLEITYNALFNVDELEICCKQAGEATMMELRDDTLRDVLVRGHCSPMTLTLQHKVVVHPGRAVFNWRPIADDKWMPQESPIDPYSLP